MNYFYNKKLTQIYQSLARMAENKSINVKANLSYNNDMSFNHQGLY